MLPARRHSCAQPSPVASGAWLGAEMPVPAARFARIAIKVLRTSRACALVAAEAAWAAPGVIRQNALVTALAHARRYALRAAQGWRRREPGPQRSPRAVADCGSRGRIDGELVPAVSCWCKTVLHPVRRQTLDHRSGCGRVPSSDLTTQPQAAAAAGQDQAACACRPCGSRPWCPDQATARALRRKTVLRAAPMPLPVCRLAVGAGSPSPVSATRSGPAPLPCPDQPRPACG